MVESVLPSSAVMVVTVVVLVVTIEVVVGIMLVVLLMNVLVKVDYVDISNHEVDNCEGVVVLKNNRNYNNGVPVVMILLSLFVC